jgi:hypothetical protein
MTVEWDYMIDIRPTWVNQSQSAHWEQAVRANFAQILSTQTGKILLAGIRFFRKWVVISPYDGSHGPCNAGEQTRDGSARDGTPYAATIPYSPHLYQNGNACYLESPLHDRGGAPDEVLFHELVHAFRTVSGKDRGTPLTTGGLRDYDDEEEFNAVLITNIFITDPSNGSKTGLRRNHSGHEPLETDLASSLSFFESSTNTFNLISAFCTDHPVLHRKLADVPATFNPIAAFVQQPAEAMKRSISAQALIRDADGWGAAIKEALFGE